jgi:hypothetical protein
MKEGKEDKPVSAYSAFELNIRNKYDACAVFQWAEYIKLLEKLKEEKFLVLPLNEMRTSFDSSKVVVGLRHDVDLNPYKALEMAKLENMYGIRSTFFFLATAEYYGHMENSILVHSPSIRDIISEVYRTGSEIGIHNDLLTIMMLYNIDPYMFNKTELAFYRSLKIPIYGTASHGSGLGKKIHISCYQIFSDFAEKDSIEYEGRKYPLGKHSMKEYGFRYESYKIPFDKYYSESGGRWNDPENFEGIIKKLDSCKTGERVQILVHPDWWGKS